MDEYQKVPTKFGNVWVIATGRDHVYVSASRNCASWGTGVPLPEESATGRHGPLTVRGVEYSVSAHLYKHPGGAWRIGEPGRTDYERRTSLSVSRIHAATYAKSHPSPSAWQAIATEITRAVGEWIKQHAAEMAEANRQAKREELAAMDEEWREAEAKAKAARKRADKLREELRQRHDEEKQDECGAARLEAAR